MLSAVTMCQQGIPFKLSPARTQIIEELNKRGLRVIVFFPGIVNDKRIRTESNIIVNTRNMSSASIKKKIRRINPDIVICTTIEDAQICCVLPYTMKKTNFYYYNLEIYVRSRRWEENNFFCKFANKIDYMKNKFKEILYVKGCTSMVIQDKLRKKISKQYWIAHPVTWLIPNSYSLGCNKYEVPHKNGVIYSGIMSNDVLKSFIQQAACINNFELTISGWCCSEVKKLKKNSNITVIQQQLSEDDYTKFLSAYDIALIWYESRDDANIRNIGLSSGKYFKHLSLGQPVIVNDAPGLAEEVRKYKVGIVINDLSELANAVGTIYANYDFYVKNIKRVYKAKYDFKKVSKHFFDTIVNETPLYNFTNDTLVSESTVLRHLLRHLILYWFRLFP